MSRSFCAVPAISMGPRHACNELVEEQCGGDGAGVGPAQVLDVGDVRIEITPIAALEWQLPNRLPGDIGSRLDLGDQSGVVADQAGHRVPRARIAAPVSVAMSTMASVLVFRGQHKLIGHHQPSLGVGVHHLHGLAPVHRQHIPHSDQGVRRAGVVHIR